MDPAYGARGTPVIASELLAAQSIHALIGRDILSRCVRCLKRFVAREIYNALIDDHRSRAAITAAA